MLRPLIDVIGDYHAEFVIREKRERLAAELERLEREAYELGHPKEEIEHRWGQ